MLGGDAASDGDAAVAAVVAPPPKMNAFLMRTPENALFNQYWFAPNTIATLVQEVEAHATRVAFISTPSVYFSLAKNSALARSSIVFDLDASLFRAGHANFCVYDFAAPDAIPAEMHHTFDFCMIDPPFITAACLEGYAATVRLLLAPGGKVLLSTVRENAALLAGLLGLKPLAFLPSLPHLVYQFTFFANYESTLLGEANPELPGDE